MKNIILKYKNNAGVNLIELMISLTIMGILAAIAAPSFETWMNNMKIKTNTENIFAGIADARAEAIKLNSSVSFVMDDKGSWNVIDVSSDKVILENKQSSTLDTVSASASPSGANTITFNGFGRVIPNADTSATITEVSIESSSSNTSVYSSRITMDAGGGVSYCSYNPSSLHPCS